MTVCQKKWRAVLLQVRTNGLAKYYNISRQGGRGRSQRGAKKRGQAMIIVYIILLFIAVLLFMLLLGFIDIVYNLITGKTSNLAEKFCEAMNVIVGVICAAVCGIGIPVLILCLLFVIGMLIIG